LPSAIIINYGRVSCLRWWRRRLCS
jgi:hypothetical protein